MGGVVAHVIIVTAPVPWFWGLGFWGVGLGTGLVNYYKILWIELSRVSTRVFKCRLLTSFIRSGTNPGSLLTLLYLYCM